MTRIWILNDKGKKQTILSSVKKGACRFYDAPFREELNVGSSFSFVVDADHDDCKFVHEENLAVFKDRNGIKREFVIKELEDVDDGANPLIRVYCEPAIAELYDEFVTDIRPQDKTAQYVLDRVLEGTRWSGKVTAELGLNSTNFYRISVMEAVNKILQVWGGELYDEVVFDENDNIVDRIVHILPRRGKDTGKRFTIDKDIEEIQRTVLSYPKTAFYGYGASLETEGGGNTRYIDFSEVEWSVANGDPVDKPKGQEWVGDPDLLDKFGRPMYDGKTKRHRFGEWKDDTIQDTEELLRKTYEALINHVNVQVNYSLKVKLFERIAGYEHEKVELGDTTVAIDRKFKRPIELQSRVIAFEYDIADPDNTGQVEMGQFLDLNSTEKRIQEIETTIDNNRGKWDNGGDPVIGDGNFPDTVPPVPSNIKIESLFQSVYISWDFNPSSYIAAYEVYASPNKGFTPLPENLLWRGKASGYEHKADVDQVWYYRFRAINTHGTASEFTQEFSAATKRIMTDDILFGAITADKLAHLAVTADAISRNFEEANILPGSILNAPDVHVINCNRYVSSVNGFNEVRAAKTSTSSTLFGITTGGRPSLSLTKDQVYTLSFELKRSTTTNFSYIQLRTADGNTYDISNNLSDISSYPADEYVRFDIVFTAPATFSNGRVVLGGRTATTGEKPEFYVRKPQIRRGDVRKEFGFSPYDTQLTEGVITSLYIAEAAVGSAAIQNAAIKRAHLENAIIGTAQIEDASITSAKIKSIVADQITSGTIKGITIEGSLIRGARIEPLSDSSAYESYIEANKIYQLRKTIYDGYQKRYEELQISSGSIVQDYGKRLDDDSHESLNKVEISKGKVALSSGKTFDTGYTSRMEMYSELGTSNNGIFGANCVDMYRNEEKVFELKQSSFNHPDTGEQVPSMIIHAEKMGFSAYYRDAFIDATGSIMLSGDTGVSILSDKKINLGSGKYGGAPIVLNSEVQIMGGNLSDGTLIPKYYAGLGLSLNKNITDLFGGLQHNGLINIDYLDITLPNTGADASTSRQYIFLDVNGKPAENIFAVFAQPTGAYSDVCSVGIQNISSSGFKVTVRGTGVSSGIAGQTIRVFLCIFYESN
ncbi:phage tail spike protein [Bacillus sonorensis]|uniref:phage tail spike protein n=1 Tax=Bacillus sonorensis TaxID=119858 RepID=UPI00405A2BEC